LPAEHPVITCTPEKGALQAVYEFLCKRSLNFSTAAGGASSFLPVNFSGSVLNVVRF
jgi:hypothetical protein